MRVSCSARPLQGHGCACVSLCATSALVDGLSPPCWPRCRRWCVCLFCEAPALMDWLRPQGLGFRRREEGGRRREEFFFAYVPMGLPCTGAGWPCPRPGCAPGCVGGCAPGCVGGPRESHIVGSFLYAGASQSFASADTDYGSQRFLSCLASGLGGERGGGGGRRRTHRRAIGAIFGVLPPPPRAGTLGFPLGESQDPARGGGLN